MECIPGPGTKHVLIDFERYRTTFEFWGAPKMSKKIESVKITKKIMNAYTFVHSKSENYLLVVLHGKTVE